VLSYVLTLIWVDIPLACGMRQSQTLHDSTVTQQPINISDHPQGIVYMYIFQGLLCFTCSIFPITNVCSYIFCIGSENSGPLSSDVSTAGTIEAVSPVGTAPTTLQASQVGTSGQRSQVGQKRPLLRDNNDPHAKVSLIYVCILSRKAYC